MTVNYINLGEIQKYEITFVQGPLDYNFYNSGWLVDDLVLVDDFLLNVKSRRRKSAEADFIKCSFSLESTQPSSFENEAPIWSYRGLLSIY